MTLPATKRNEILRLLRQGGLSQREIGRRVGVHHTTVWGVARRQWKYLTATPAATPGDRDIQEVRCPGCGGKTQLPCMVCDRRARQEKALAKKRLTLRRRSR